MRRHATLRTPDSDADAANDGPLCITQHLTTRTRCGDLPQKCGPAVGCQHGHAPAAALGSSRRATVVPR
eukprot:COSAG01_NODE_48806_length_377_cov_9.593525_1_plen_68_part_01